MYNVRSGFDHNSSLRRSLHFGSNIQPVSSQYYFFNREFDDDDEGRGSFIQPGSECVRYSDEPRRYRIETLYHALVARSQSPWPVFHSGIKRVIRLRKYTLDRRLRIGDSSLLGNTFFYCHKCKILDTTMNPDNLCYCTDLQQSNLYITRRNMHFYSILKEIYRRKLERLNKMEIT